MRINDIVRIAGVTLQTVRHYHRIGLLPEPGRDPNNYRRYEVDHLVRLLRIRRLTALGFPLSKVANLLDGGREPMKDALVTLDRELEAQIARLTQQRMLIADLLDSPSAPDVPVALAPFNATFWAGRSDDLERAAGHAVLMAHFASDEEISQIAEIFDRFVHPDLRDTMIELSERFGRLDAHSTIEEVSNLIEDYIAAISAVEQSTRSFKSLNQPSAAKLLVGHALAGANSNQQKVIKAVIRRT